MPELPDVYSELKALQENRRSTCVYRPSRKPQTSSYLTSFHFISRFRADWTGWGGLNKSKAITFLEKEF